MIRGIIFDAGNTLMYWEGDGQEIDAQANERLVTFLTSNGLSLGPDFPALFRAAREDGWRVAEETHIERTIAEALNTVLVQLGYSSRDGLLPKAIEQFFTVGEVHERAYPEAQQALERLDARGLRVGLISNADDDGLVQRAMVRLRLASYLDPIVTSAGLKWRKPNPEIFRYVANLWQLAPEDLVMVGDAPKYDILGAHWAGMHGILIDRNEGHWWQQIPDDYSADLKIRPDATVHSLLEIPDILEHW